MPVVRAAIRRPIPDVLTSAVAASRGGSDARRLNNHPRTVAPGTPSLGAMPSHRCSGAAEKDRSRIGACGIDHERVSDNHHSTASAKQVGVPQRTAATPWANSTSDANWSSSNERRPSAVRGAHPVDRGTQSVGSCSAFGDGGDVTTAGDGGGYDRWRARAADFDLLVEHAIAAIRAAGDRPDPVFGPFAELNSLVRAVTYHEGRLLEQGMARLAAEHPSLRIMPSETALPIVPAALEMLMRNDWNALRGIRLRSEVHYRTTYTPDLFIVDLEQHRALLVDMKRSLASYPERRLDLLRRRMMAAALIAADWLYIEGRIAGVKSVEAAIIDGSSERRDRTNGIFALDEIGELIDVEDAGDALLALRAKFAQRVQEEIGAACLRAVGIETTIGSGSFAAAVRNEDLTDANEIGDPSAASHEGGDRRSGSDVIAGGSDEAGSYEPLFNATDEGDGSPNPIGTARQEPETAHEPDAAPATIVGFARGRPC